MKHLCDLTSARLDEFIVKVQVGLIDALEDFDMAGSVAGEGNSGYSLYRAIDRAIRDEYARSQLSEPNRAIEKPPATTLAEINAVQALRYAIAKGHVRISAENFEGWSDDCMCERCRSQRAVYDFFAKKG